MLVTLLGIVTFVKLSHPEKAKSPILLTVLPAIVPGIARFFAKPEYSVISTVPSSRISYS